MSDMCDESQRKKVARRSEREAANRVSAPVVCGSDGLLLFTENDERSVEVQPFHVERSGLLCLRYDGRCYVACPPHGPGIIMPLICARMFAAE